MNSELVSSVLNSYRPDLIPVTGNLIAAAFPLMKIYPAEACIRRAMEDGRINERTLIVESSSGTMALSLAIVCNLLGSRLAIVSDTACDDHLRNRLEDLGASVHIVNSPSAVGGIQRARLNRVSEICKSDPNSWWLNQYDNPTNSESYISFAAQLVESIGRIDFLIGSVGSGGSVCGTARYVRCLWPELAVVGVDTFNSVLFGQDDGPRTLRGLGNSLIPANLDHTAFDEVHWVSAAAAFTATRWLHRETSLYRGGSSGACWLVARYWAQKYPSARIVCLLPDDGHRYSNTIYDQEYLAARNLWLTEAPKEPVFVDEPKEARSDWAAIHWRRRALSEVAGEQTFMRASI